MRKIDPLLVKLHKSPAAVDKELTDLSLTECTRSFCDSMVMRTSSPIPTKKTVDVLVQVEHTTSNRSSSRHEVDGNGLETVEDCRNTRR